MGGEGADAMPSNCCKGWKDVVLDDRNRRTESIDFQRQDVHVKHLHAHPGTDTQVGTVICSENLSVFQEICFLLDGLDSTFQFAGGKR